MRCIDGPPQIPGAGCTGSGGRGPGAGRHLDRDFSAPHDPSKPHPCTAMAHAQAPYRLHDYMIGVLAAFEHVQKVLGVRVRPNPARPKPISPLDRRYLDGFTKAYVHRSRLPTGVWHVDRQEMKLALLTYMQRVAAYTRLLLKRIALRSEAR